MTYACRSGFNKPLEKASSEIVDHDGFLSFGRKKKLFSQRSFQIHIILVRIIRSTEKVLPLSCWYTAAVQMLRFYCYVREIDTHQHLAITSSLFYPSVWNPCGTTEIINPTKMYVCRQCTLRLSGGRKFNTESNQNQPKPILKIENPIK